jgi:hypothetical protein
VFEKPKTCAYRKSNIMVVAVATLAFSVGINSSANAVDVYINDYSGLEAINTDILNGDDIENTYFLNSNIELPSLDVVAEEARTYIEGIFRGIFDGQGHTLSNLNAPLFDVIGGVQLVDDEFVNAPGEVRNLGVKTGEAGIIGDASGEKVGVLAGELSGGSLVDRVGVAGSISTTAGDSAGGLVGVAGYGTTISNSHSLVSINTVAVIDAEGNNVSGIVGGLVGLLDSGTISNSTSTGPVSTTSGSTFAGGLVGLATDATIGDSSSSSDVTIADNDGNLLEGAAGGLVGIMATTNIYNSSASGAVTSTGSSGIIFGPMGTGGLVGFSGYGSSIYNSWATGDVDSQSSYTGGLIGLNYDSQIGATSASGSVTVNGGLLDDIVMVGGLVGYSDVQIGNSSASGDVTVNSNNEIQFVGGLVGMGYGVSDSAASGSVTARNVASLVIGIGGLAGAIWNVIDHSAAIGDVSTSGGYATEIGGLVGVIDNDVNNSSASGNVLVENISGNGPNSIAVGGLVGRGGSTPRPNYGGVIRNSSATGDVTAPGGYRVGGLAGEVNAIYNSIASGVTDGGTEIGLLAGFVATEYGSDMTNPLIGGIFDSVYLPDPEEQRLSADIEGVTLNAVTQDLSGDANPQGLIDGVVVGPQYLLGPTEPPMYEGAELLNYMSETSVWGENPFVNSGRPYILALREFGFYTDKTPKPTAASIAYVNSNPKFTQPDSTILRLFLYLAGDESILITVEDFEVLGVTGVNEKNLPVLLKLLKKVDMLTLNQKTITENVKIADELLKKKKKK